MRFFIKWAFIRWLLMLAGLLWFILSLSHPQMAVGAKPHVLTPGGYCPEFLTFNGATSSAVDPYSGCTTFKEIDGTPGAAYTEFTVSAADRIIVWVKYPTTGSTGFLGITVDGAAQGLYGLCSGSGDGVTYCAQQWDFTRVENVTIKIHNGGSGGYNRIGYIEVIDTGASTETPTLVPSATPLPSATATLGPQETMWLSGPYYQSVGKADTGGTYVTAESTQAFALPYVTVGLLIRSDAAVGNVTCSFVADNEVNPQSSGSYTGASTFEFWTSQTYGTFTSFYSQIGFTPATVVYWGFPGPWYLADAGNLFEFTAQVSGWEAGGCSNEFWLVHYSIQPTPSPATVTPTAVVNACWEPGIGTATPDWDNVPPEYAVCLEMCTEPGATPTPPWTVPTLGCLELDITPFVPPCADEASCQTATANPPTPLPTLALPGCYTPTVALTSTPGAIPIDPICYLPPGEREDDPIVLDFGQVIVTDGACYTLVPGIDITIPAFLGLWAEINWSTYEWQFCIDWVTIPDMSIAGIQYTNQLIIGAAVLVIMSLLFKL